MLGAIVGDIVGSVYEWHNIKTKEFPLFRDDCFFTDDTVMTCAVAEAVMNGGKKDDFIDAMKKYGRMYPDAGYGGRFGTWVFSDDREPYSSYGNGSAMRVSPCAWVMDCGFCARTGMWPSNGRAGAQLSAEVTHNHPEGIKGAMATADAIFMCRYYFGGYYGDYEQPINDNPAECKRRITFLRFSILRPRFFASFRSFLNWLDGTISIISKNLIHYLIKRAVPLVTAGLLLHRIILRKCCDRFSIR